MKKFLSLSLAVLMLHSVFGLVLLPAGVAARSFDNTFLKQEVLTNQKVIEMVKSGLSSEIVIAKIKNSKNSFDTSTNAIKELKKAGISDSIILEMVQNASTGSGQSQNNSSSTNKSTDSSEKLTLPDGIPVKMRIARNMSSADAKTGETVDFEVLEDVKVGETVVIARGAVALGTVTNAKPKGRMGKGGKLDITIDSVRLVSGEKIALRAVKENKGSGSTGAMTGAIVASSILFFPAAPFFLLMKGKDIKIPKGTEITAYTNSDITLDASKF